LSASGTGERKLKRRKRIKQQTLIERKKTESKYLFKLAQALAYFLTEKVQFYLTTYSGKYTKLSLAGTNHRMDYPSDGS